MPTHPLVESSEVEIAYWRKRVASLEILISELLVKNERMRSALKAELNPAGTYMQIQAPEADQSSPRS